MVTKSNYGNSQIQTIIDHFSEKPNIEFTDDSEEQDNSITDSEEVLEAKPLIQLRITKMCILMMNLNMIPR